jgi:hypothetical protein
MATWQSGAMRADRDPSWVRDVAARRGWAYRDESTSRTQRYLLHGDLGPAGLSRPWTTAANRHYLDDGGAEDWVEWECPSLLAADPSVEIVVIHGSGDGIGATGDAMGDLAMLGIGVAARLFRRRRELTDRTVTDVLAQRCQVQDPARIFTGRVQHLFNHWPVVDGPPHRAVKAIAGFLGAPDLPPDAPPQQLAISMTPHSRLSMTSRDWWRRGPWLEHQTELGIAIGRAVVAAGTHA